MSRKQKVLAGLAIVAAAFAFGVVMFGAFVRLSNAGLSCPDWPTCYGQVTWPGHAHEIARADAQFPDRPYESGKAWREQVHRFLAGSLGVMVLAIALISAWSSRWRRYAVMLAAILAVGGVTCYMHGRFEPSALFSVGAIGLPLLAGLSLPAAAAQRLAMVVLGVVIFQAMLGMWTVTLLLRPVVVMGHLLGGITTFALLSYVALRMAGVGAQRGPELQTQRVWVGLGIVLVAAQIALGGWTSSNYAALACGTDFPTCLGQWMPPTDFGQGFTLTRGIGVNYEGGVLDMAARSAIQLVHRIGALVVFCYLGWLSHGLARRGLRAHGRAIAVVLLLQIALGISNVHFGLPLPVATAHNGGAALLLFCLIASLAALQRPLSWPQAGLARVQP
ncbi:COX15/CtaA family protein [Frateuria aurantia]